jgi:hypothetical protein
MARGRRKQVDEEKVLKAIEWLDNGGTKKGACEILGVSNNKTMETIITEYKEGKERDRQMRAKKRKTAVSKEELAMMITDYLQGASLEELSATYYRSKDYIKAKLEKAGALLRQNEKIDPLNPPMLPDQCMAEEFEIGEHVWSARYGCIARVDKLFKPEVYRIIALGENTREYAYQHVSELGSLRHLKDLGVNVNSLIGFSMTDEEIQYEINKAVAAANKRK